MINRSVEEIARDIIIAWLSHHNLPSGTPEDTGAAIAKVYTDVVQAVHEGKEMRLGEEEHRGKSFGEEW
jgi:hypothetical protein